jgi:hypothetical protein
LIVKESIKITINLNDKVNLKILVTIVDSLSKQLIMRIDVMRKMNAIIKVGEKKITLANKHEFNINIIPPEIWSTELLVFSFELTVDKDYHFLANTSRVIYTELAKEKREQLGWKESEIVKAIENRELLFIVGNSVVNLKNEKFATVIYNLTEKEITIRKEQIIAQVERLD